MAFLKKQKITWVHDSSNERTDFTRNKIRHKILPYFQNNINNRTIDHIYQSSLIFSETEEILKITAQNKLNRLRKRKSDYVFSIEKLKKIKQILRFYIYRKIFKDLSGNKKGFYFSNFKEIEQIYDSLGSKKVFLPNNVLVLKKYNYIEFVKSSKLDKKIDKAKEITAKKTLVKFENYRIRLKRMQNSGHEFYKHKHPLTSYLDYDKIEFPIKVRHRLPGDKFKPLGMVNFKKLKDFFIDEKISKFDRDKVLIFCDKRDRIIWIGGHRLDQRFAITKNTKKILKIKLQEIPNGRFRSAERKKRG